MRQQISVGRTGRAILLAALVVALAGCGGGGSDEATDTVITTDTTSTDTTSTDTFGETTDTTDTSATSTVDAGETATWRGDTFTVSDVETSDTAPEPDPFGEMAEAENGVWLSFKITPAEDDSGIWSAEFTSNMLIKGGDGVVYDSSSHQSFHNNAGEQNEFDASDFLVWVDIPEAAVSGAVLEINDGLHTVDPDPSNPFADPVPDPAYATRVNLGL